MSAWFSGSSSWGGKGKIQAEESLARKKNKEPKIADEDKQKEDAARKQFETDSSDEDWSHLHGTRDFQIVRSEFFVQCIFCNDIMMW